MKEFLYYEPTTIEEAVELINIDTKNSMPLAGGTDLIRRMRKGTIQPGALINLNNIQTLKNIRYDVSKGLAIGAGVKIAEIESSETIAACCPSILEVADYFGTPQVRNVATLAGNICNGSPASDYPPLLLALNASVRLRGPDSVREILLVDLYQNHSSTVHENGEILTEIIIPPIPANAKYGCARHTTRDYLDIGIINVAVYLELDQNCFTKVRIGLGSLAPIPVRAFNTEKYLIGKPTTTDVIQEAAGYLNLDIQPIDDFRASAEYRKAMVQTYLIRVLNKLLA